MEKERLPHHVYGLDGLRTIAIFGVTAFHLMPQVFHGGYLGVCLFFILTGFLSAYQCEVKFQDGTFGIFSYYVKRLRRIYPDLIFVILVTIGAFYFLAPDTISAIRPEVISILGGFNNWWQIAQNADYFTRLINQSPFTHLWFLGIELQYYVLWPFLFVFYLGLCRLYDKRFGIAALTALALISACLMPFMYHGEADITRLYYGTDTRIYALLLGAAFGLYQSQYHYSLPHKMWIIVLKVLLWLLLCGILLVSYVAADGHYPLIYQGVMVLMTVLMCIFLVLTIDQELAIGRWMDNPVFRWIGKKSYAIFLWQYPVIFLFQQCGWDVLTLLGLPETPSAPYLNALAETAVIIVLAILSDTFINNLMTLPHIWKTINHRQLAVKVAILLCIALPAMPLMGYGCLGIWQSADQKVADTDELKASLAENEAALKDQQVTKKPVDESQLSGIPCIGDSVMLGSAMEIKKVLPGCYIDAKVSRYVGDALPIAQRMNENNQLGKIVLISLGTNGPLDGQYQEQTDKLMKYLGNDRKIFWVNCYCPSTGWQESNNQYLKILAQTHPNLVIIDWASLIKQHPEWLTGDKIHPNDQGTVQYAKLIHDTISTAISQ